MKPELSSNYQQLNPSDGLIDFVDSYWESKNLTNKPLKRTIFPDGLFKLVVILVNNKISIVFLTGLWPKESQIKISANATVYGIKFKILAAEYIFQREIASLLQSQQILDPSFWEINNIQLGSLEIFVKQIETVIIEKINQNKELRKEKLSLSQLIYQTNGNVLVKDVAKQVHWRERQINRYFSKYLGISLKSYLNIQKMYAAYIPIMMKEFSPTEGFHDQSHFIKEIKKHTNHTPKELEEQKNDRFIQLKNIKEN